jgi:hypothetical protein
MAESPVIQDLNPTFVKTKTSAENALPTTCFPRHWGDQSLCAVKSQDQKLNLGFLGYTRLERIDL